MGRSLKKLYHRLDQYLRNCQKLSAKRCKLMRYKLTWLDVAIAQAERTALTSLTGDADFLDAIARLLAAIDTHQSVDMVEIPQRPRQKDLPESLKSQLTIQPTQLKWTGRLHSPEQLQALQTLTGNQPFTTAIQAVLADLNSKTN
jgi:hypothetical protein